MPYKQDNQIFFFKKSKKMVQFVILLIIFSINKPFKCDNLIFLAHFKSILSLYDQKLVKWHKKSWKKCKNRHLGQVFESFGKNWHENGQKMKKNQKS